MVLTRAGVTLSEATDEALAEMQRYQQVSNLWEQVPGFIGPTLTALKERGYRLVVVSNANGTLRSVFQRLGLTPFFDLLVDSAEEGIEKPDPRLFELALERAGASPAQALHVGDMYHVDIVGARRAGLAALLVDEADLRAGVDCQRVRSIAELPMLVTQRSV